MKIRRENNIVIDLGYIPTNAEVSRMLMGEHTVKFSFELTEKVDLKKGDYVTYESEQFSLNKNYIPIINKRTNGYLYELIFYDFTERLKDYIFKYDGDFDFSLTATGDMFLNLVKQNTPFKTITIGDFPLDVKTINFNIVDVYSALVLIAEEYELEWWFEGNELNLGKLQYGTLIDLAYDKELNEITVNQSTEQLITRLYAFGQNRNLPKSYGGALNVPPIDLYEDLPESEVVEGVVTFDIYPRQTNTIVSVESVFIPDEEEPTEGTLIYTIKGDNTFTLTDDDIIAGKPLMVAFTKGLLSGKEYELIIRDNNKFEIVYQEFEDDYSPNDILKPVVGDTFFFFNFQADKVMPSLIEQAEAELTDKAMEYIQKTKSEYVYDVEMRSIEAEKLNIDLQIGQSVKLVSETLGTVYSRVQKYTKSIYNKYESTYQIGDSPEYSRLTALERTTSDNTYKLLSTTGITLEQAHAIIQSVGKRSYLSKIANDIANGHISFQQGVTVNNGAEIKGLTKLDSAYFGKYTHKLEGGVIDSAGNAELESMVLRSFLEVPTIRYNELEYIGEEIIIGAGAVLKDVEYLGDDRYKLTLKLEDGQFNPFRPSDLLKGIYNMDEDGNFTDFGTTYVSVSSIDEHEMIVVLADKSDVVGNSNMPPRKFMHLARIGNFIDTDRQSYISLSAKDRAITQYGGVNAFAKKNADGKNVRAGTVTTQWGRAEGLEFIENFDNLPITKDSDVLYTDTLLYNKQIKVDYEGVVIKEYIDRGQWFEGMECQVTETTIDEVWIEAEKFRLIDRPIVDTPFTTTEKPTRESEDWMLILSIKKEIDKVAEKRSLRIEKWYTPGYDTYREGQQNYNHTLALKIFHDTEDVTDTINIAQFTWMRISENTLGDPTWNDLHANAGSSIDITIDDLAGDTSFIVQFYDVETQQRLTERF